nr:helix-turn-helix domain-containing protein [Levilactobacillus brevis]
MRNHGNSLREIASHIKKSYSTISRELSRNSTGKSYSPSKAQESAYIHLTTVSMSNQR